MKKRITAIIIILLMLLAACVFCCETVANGERNYSKTELQTLIEENQQIKYHSSNMASSARVLGWKDEDPLIKQLQEKWQNANNSETDYQVKLDEILAEEARIEAERKAKEEAEKRAKETKLANAAAEYPAATTIWKAMKAQGWNDYVCAGIMGNIMAEVGGQTLNIRWNASSSTYYGMCQWNKAYSQVWGKDLQGQCDFLISTIKYEFDTYGSKYKKGFNFNSFLNLQDCRQAALAFARCYERCASASHAQRQKNAVTAYNYFVK